MKIKTNKLKQFLNEIRMGEIQECMFQFKEDGMYVSVMSTANTHQAKGTLKKEAFEEYEPIGNLGISELTRFITNIGRMGDMLDFEVKGNLFIAKNNKKEFSY